MKQKRRRAHRRRRGNPKPAWWEASSLPIEPKGYVDVVVPRLSSTKSIVPFVYQGEVIPKTGGLIKVPSVFGAGFFYIPGVEIVLALEGKIEPSGVFSVRARPGIRNFSWWTSYASPSYASGRFARVDFDDEGVVTEIWHGGLEIKKF